jgi:hypothetical protein
MRSYFGKVQYQFGNNAEESKGKKIASVWTSR